ncbi:MAG: energy-coupling factor ABC transporter ATP-binding protein [Thermodesulfobacteriota bacterium]
MEEIVKIRDLKFQYPDGTTLVFDGYDFTVGKGERVVMLGPNGSGKSTLLSLLLGLLKPAEGEIEVLGVNPLRDYDKIRERVGALLQDVDLQIIAPRVWDDVSFSPRNYGYKEEEIAMLVDDTLKKLDIEHLKDKIPHYLSGGEKTKVGLAGALVINPELLILDEPFEHIDPACRTELIKLLNKVNKESGTAIILSTHNMNTVPLIADTVYLIADGGKIVGKGTPKEIFSQVETLSECHIEPPVLGELFSELKRLGVEMDVSLTVDEAACTIANAMAISKNKTGLG